MTDVQFFSLIVSILLPLGGVLAFLYKELKEWRSETREETKEIRKEIVSQNERLDKNIATQSARSDRLYEMFIDLLKEKQKPTT